MSICAKNAYCAKSSFSTITCIMVADIGDCYMGDTYVRDAGAVNYLQI